MTVKLLILKSGEDLVSNVSEMITDDGKVVGYFLQKACIVKIKDFVKKEESESGSAKFNIVFYPWIPLSNSDVVTIPVDWVVTMVDPIPKLVNMYKDQILENATNDKGTNFDEQSSSNNED